MQFGSPLWVRACLPPGLPAERPEGLSWVFVFHQAHPQKVRQPADWLLVLKLSAVWHFSHNPICSESGYHPQLCLGPQVKKSCLV